MIISSAFHQIDFDWASFDLSAIGILQRNFDNIEKKHHFALVWDKSRILDFVPKA